MLDSPKLGHIEWILAAANAQEAGGLFERLRAEARHRLQLHARTESPLVVAILHYLERGPRRDPRDIP